MGEAPATPGDGGSLGGIRDCSDCASSLLAIASLGLNPLVVDGNFGSFDSGEESGSAHREAESSISCLQVECAGGVDKGSQLEDKSAIPRTMEEASAGTTAQRSLICSGNRDLSDLDVFADTICKEGSQSANGKEHDISELSETADCKILAKRKEEISEVLTSLTAEEGHEKFLLNDWLYPVSVLDDIANGGMGVIGSKSAMIREINRCAVVTAESTNGANCLLGKVTDDCSVSALYVGNSTVGEFAAESVRNEQGCSAGCHAKDASDHHGDQHKTQDCKRTPIQSDEKGSHRCEDRPGDLQPSSTEQHVDCYGFSAECSDKNGADEIVIPQPTAMIVFRRRNPNRAASARNIDTNVTSLCLNKVGSGARKINKAADKIHSLSGSTIFFSKDIRKRRSCIHKNSNPSNWGSVENLLHISNFKLENSAADLNPTWLMMETSKKQPTSGKTRFNDKASRKVTSMKDNPAPVDDSSVFLDSLAVGKVACEREKKFIGSKMIQINGKLFKKDMKSSLTQDAVSGNTQSIHAEALSCLSLNPKLKLVNGGTTSDPESSPDSTIINPVHDVVRETSSSDAAVNGSPMHENSLLDIMSAEGGLNVCISSTYKATENLTSAVQSDAQPQKGPSKRNKSCKKQMRAGRKDSDLVQSQTTEKKISNVLRMSNAKEINCLGACRQKDDAQPNCENLNMLAPRTEKPTPHGVMCNKDSAAVHRKEGRQEMDPCQEACGRSVLSDGSQVMLTPPELSDRSLHAGKCSSIEEAMCHSSVSAPVASDFELETSVELDRQELTPSKVAWVCCDDCQKWRSIPATLANVLDETNCRWICQDNTDTAYADCSIPQEKTNAEINIELELSDCDDDCYTQPQKGSVTLVASDDANSNQTSRPEPWTRIRSNVFLHRNRRSQPIDEVMVCMCKPPENGTEGCQHECLNRMLNIECTRGTCPCGDLCANQKFQKRNYAKVRRYSCGNKGFGLKLLENVSEGQFIIEYVGEVLNMAAYESRQKYYASRGQRHFYFMTLNGGEVIDACKKGNLSRFINHSCRPNCRTDKWIVNGELCIGLFALRDIKKGEELTFDYHYVRVADAAAQKCFCGSSNCRGFLGEELLNSDNVVQSDSLLEYGHAMIVDNNEVRATRKSASDADANIAAEVSDQDKICNLDSPTDNLDTSFANEIIESEIPDSSCNRSELRVSDKSTTCSLPLASYSGEVDSSLQVSSFVEPEEVLRDPVHVSRTASGSEMNLGSEKNLSTRQSKLNSVGVTKTCIFNGNNLRHVEPATIHDNVSKKGGNDLISEDLTDQKRMADKFKLNGHPKSSPSKDMTKIRTTSMQSSVFEDTFEKKLTELLDCRGGISKAKDACNGFLKLLFVTAAEGENAGLSKSVRDLCMLIDAILKTKSHSVLMDIIAKNGLQMLHNILKQNRDNHNRTPVMRKLLKVFEFLAGEGILLPKHIYGAPPCTGMESFKDSLLKLMRHSDKQVHQIARQFCDKWIPRTTAKFNPVNQRGVKSDIPKVVSLHYEKSASAMVKRMEPSSKRDERPECSSIPYASTTGAKRKSKWDQRPDQNCSEPDSPSTVNGARYKRTWDQLYDQNHRIPDTVTMGYVEEQKCKSDHTASDARIMVHRARRKSKWDQPPADDHSHSYASTSVDRMKYRSQWEQPLGDKNNSSASEEQDRISGAKFRKVSHGPVNPEQGAQDQVHRKLQTKHEEINAEENGDDEPPPGFEFRQEFRKQEFIKADFAREREVHTGYLQEIYQPCINISYGLPVDLIRQSEATESRVDSSGQNRLNIVPGVPFHPFPPLPPRQKAEVAK